MTSPPLQDAAAVWTYLMKQGGLRPESWDAPLADELRASFRLGPGSIAEQLQARDVTTEALVYGLLKAAEPFSEMMGELLTLFDRHDIKRADGNAEILFDFDAPGRPPLRFDLDAFRRAQRTWADATVSGLDQAWLQLHAWELLSLLKDRVGDVDFQQARPETRAWFDDYWQGAWPIPPLRVPATGSSQLDVELRYVVTIWTSMVATIRAAAVDRDALQRIRAQSSNGLLAELGQIESDYFLFQLAHAVLAAADASRRAVPADSLAAELADYFARNPLPQDPVERLVEQLLNLLDLPIWKQRHELYAAWILVEILSAAPAASEIVPAEPGVLRFPFKATRMAELLGCEPGLAVWSEVRTPLTDPAGVTRKANVQPDYSVIAGASDPRTAPEASVLEVECKQYQRPDTKAFAHALQDYASARPNALVLLVSHGPLNRDRVLQAVPTHLRNRVDAIPHLHPRCKPARTRFRELVDQRLAPLCPTPALRCRLSWPRPPNDLDLHLAIEARGARHHVSYNDRGALDAAPFASLAEDVCEPGGYEEITIARWLPKARYLLVVHGFGDEQLAGSGATVTVEQGPRTMLDVTCPDHASGTWWVVAELFPDRPPRIRNELRSRAPFP